MPVLSDTEMRALVIGTTSCCDPNIVQSWNKHIMQSKNKELRINDVHNITIIITMMIDMTTMTL